MQYNVNHDDTNLTNKENCALTCQCSCALCLKGVLGLGGHVVTPRIRNTLDGHVVIGVVLGFTTDTQYTKYRFLSFCIL